MTDFDMPEEFQNDYDRYIKDYPYNGWNDVLGGGGENQDADIYVPPQQNLYNAGIQSTLQSIPGIGIYIVTPVVVALILGLIIGYVGRPKAQPSIEKLKHKIFD